MSKSKTEQTTEVVKATAKPTRDSSSLARLSQKMFAAKVVRQKAMSKPEEV